MAKNNKDAAKKTRVKTAFNFGAAFRENGFAIVRAFLRDPKAWEAKAFEGIENAIETIAAAQQDEAFRNRLKGRPVTEEDLEEYKKDSEEYKEASKKHEEYKADLDKYIGPIFSFILQVANPSPKNATYTKLIVDELMKRARKFNHKTQDFDPIIAEDVYKMRVVFKEFENFSENLKGDGKSTNITDYKTYRKLEETVRPYTQSRAKRQEKAVKITDHIRSTSVVLHDGPAGKIVIPQSAEAAQFWGQNTTWCISATKSDNAFDRYPDHPIFIFIPKITREMKKTYPDYSSFKFCITAQSLIEEENEKFLELKDELDEDVEFDQIPDHIKKLYEEAIASLPPEQANYLSLLGWEAEREYDIKIERFVDSNAWDSVLQEFKTQIDYIGQNPEKNFINAWSKFVYNHPDYKLYLKKVGRAAFADFDRRSKVEEPNIWDLKACYEFLVVCVSQFPDILHHYRYKTPKPTDFLEDHRKDPLYNTRIENPIRSFDLIGDENFLQDVVKKNPACIGVLTAVLSKMNHLSRSLLKNLFACAFNEAPEALNLEVFFPMIKCFFPKDSSGKATLLGYGGLVPPYLSTLVEELFQENRIHIDKVVDFSLRNMRLCPESLLGDIDFTIAFLEKVKMQKNDERIFSLFHLHRFTAFHGGPLTMDIDVLLEHARKVKAEMESTPAQGIELTAVEPR